MLEALSGILIFSLGVLGIVAMQATAIARLTDANLPDGSGTWLLQHLRETDAAASALAQPSSRLARSGPMVAS